MYILIHLEIPECEEYYPSSDINRDEVLVPGGIPSLGGEFPHMVGLLCFEFRFVLGKNLFKNIILFTGNYWIWRKR